MVIAADAPHRAAPRTHELENGELVSAGEFLRRYERSPRIAKVQLIEGRVFMPSPVRADQHGQPDNLIQGWLMFYAAHTAGTLAFTNTTLVLDGDNIPQPDAMLCLSTEAGGRARVEEDGYVHGSPELIVEIAATSGSVDLHDKLRAYRRNGVAEYLVWLTREDRVIWFILEDGEFQPLAPDAHGTLTSRRFAGLCLDFVKLLARDGAGVLACLQNRLASRGAA